jgi:hypothetical protein
MSGASGRNLVPILWWTLLTIVLVVLLLLFVVSARVFPGRKSIGDVQEQSFRLWSGLWKKEGADRLR